MIEAGVCDAFAQERFSARTCKPISGRLSHLLLLSALPVLPRDLARAVRDMCGALRMGVHAKVERVVIEFGCVCVRTGHGLWGVGQSSMCETAKIECGAHQSITCSGAERHGWERVTGVGFDGRAVAGDSGGACARVGAGAARRREPRKKERRRKNSSEER